MLKLIGLFLILLAAVVVIIFAKSKPKSFREFVAILLDIFGSTEAKKLNAGLPYHSRQHLLTKGELAFYRVLKEAVGDQYTIAMKVRLADIITCPADSWHAGYGARISQKHVDFVLVDPDNCGIKAVVELNDKTHRRASRQKRDKFLAEALRVADVPMFVVPASSQYHEPLIRDALLRGVVTKHPKDSNRQVSKMS
ncbi:MAG: hypothetical protein DHS20C16_03640 [Phycisphaerae bacterium]|nr:MAG: hypothetical protein DHS20C16_03640 [Phycisphaerae bacterium]